MSQRFEKETAASTAKSLMGALVALGSGFIFLFLGLVAVTASTAGAERESGLAVIRKSLEADLLAWQGEISVSEDRSMLRLRPPARAGQSEEITYKIVGETGDVVRAVGGQSRKLARLQRPRFESGGGLLRLRWGESGRMSLAIDRWSRRPRS